MTNLGQPYDTSLIVDDDANIRSALGRLFSREGDRPFSVAESAEVTT